MRRIRPATERFWAKVDKFGPSPVHEPSLGPCWLWTGNILRSGGYGQFYESPERRTMRAHRWTYESMVGEIPDGMVLDHLCRVPRCVNPTHLEPVTRRENCRRGIKGELTTHCPQGHPYDEKNTYTSQSRQGWRACRICRKEHMDRYNAQRATA